MPYTRDIGRYDPDGQDWFDPDKWSSIGEDFPIRHDRRHPISWERVGILRIGRNDGHIAVQYRVQACTGCERLFDVYANYSKASLGKLWPHVFGPGATGPMDIAPYDGESWMIWIVRRCGGLLRSGFLGAVMIGLLLFGSSFLAWLLPGRPMTGQGVSADLLASALTRGVATCGLIAFLIIAERYVHFMQTTDQFDDLLQVLEPGGIVHWRNFTLCRFVGVQSTQGRADSGNRPMPRLTQVDIVAGLSSSAILLAAWLLDISRGGPSGAAIGQQAATSWLWIDRSLELFFWLAFAHLLGAATWLAMNSAMYVLSGVRKIPMKLDPYRDFAQAQPLRVLQNFSIATMLAVFVTILTLTSVLLALPQGDHWLLSWMQWGLTLIFVGIGLGTRNSHFLALAIAYAAVSSALSDAVVYAPLFGRHLVLNWTVLLLGVFFTVLMVYQVLLADRITSELFASAKSRELGRIGREIETIQSELASLATPPDPKSKTSAGRQARQQLLLSFETLLRIRDHVANVRISPTLPKRIGQFAGPLLSSLVLPTLWDQILLWIQR